MDLTRLFSRRARASLNDMAMFKSDTKRGMVIIGLGKQKRLTYCRFSGFPSCNGGESRQKLSIARGWSIFNFSWILSRGSHGKIPWHPHPRLLSAFGKSLIIMIINLNQIGKWEHSRIESQKLGYIVVCIK